MANTENGKIIYQIGFNIQKEQLNSLKKSLEDIRDLTNKDLMKINTTDINQANKDLVAILEDAEKIQEALTKAFSPKLNTVNIETFKASLKDSNKSLSSIYQDFSKAGAQGQVAFRNLTTSLLSTNVQLRQSHELLDKMAKTFANSVRWSMASGAVNNLTRSVEQAWGYVKSLDTSLNNIQIVTGKSADEMKRFAEQANSAAKGLGATTTDYTNAALIYAQQGLSDKEVEARTDITLKTANVTQQSAADVSEQLTAVWNGYKVNADEAELYVDRLAAVAATTASDLEELSKGMGKVASAAANMGVNEEQLAAQLSTIISVTKQAPQSVGTALRTVYARISDIQAGLDDEVSLGNYSSKMADVGINVLDATGKLRDMGEVIEEIGGKWQDMSREQQIYLTQTMAGQRQYNNLLSLFENFDQYEAALATAQNAAGTLQEQQDIYMESTAAHLDKLKASVEDVYDSLLDPDALEPLIDGLSEAATLLANFVDALGGGGVVLQTLGSIAVTVFSRNIAAGIQTTIDNFERGKIQAEQFRQAIQEAENLQSRGKIDDVDTQFLTGKQKQILSIASSLPEKEYVELQQKIKAFNQELNKLTVAREKVDDLTKSFQKLVEIAPQFEKFKNWQGIFDSGKEEFKAFQKQIKDTSTEFSTLEQSLEELQKTFAKNVQPFEDTEEALEKLAKLWDAQGAFSDVFQNLIGPDDQESDFFKTFSQNVKQELIDLKKEVDGFTTDTPNLYDKLAVSFQKLYTTIQNQIKELEKLMNMKPKVQAEAQTQAQTDSRQAQGAVDTKKEDLQEGLNRGKQVVGIKSLTETIAAVGRLTAGVKQFQNLGSIWKNQDLSAGEKLFQIISNLAISLPMMITSIISLSEGFKKLQTWIGVDTIQTVANAASKGALTGALELATQAQLKFNAAVSAHPIMALITAVTAAIAIIGMFVKAQEQARKQRIENNNQIIEESQKIQQQVAANKALYDSLDQLNQKYKEHEISRSELKSGVQDLISQYGLEEEAANRLRSSYDNLEESIKALRQEQAKKAADAARDEFAAAAEVFDDSKVKLGRVNRAQVSYDKESGFSVKDTQTITINEAQKMSGAVRAAFQEAGFKYQQGTNGNAWLTLETDTDLNSLTETRDKIKEAFDKANQQIDKSTDKLETWYKEAQDIVRTEAEVFSKVRTARDHQLQTSAQQTGANLESNGTIDFGATNNALDYINQINQLKKAFSEGFLTSDDFNFSEDQIKEQASKLASKYASENYKDLFAKYDELNKIIENLEEKTGQVLPENVEKLLKGLNQEELEEFFKVDDSVLKNWELLETVLKSIQDRIKDVQESDVPEKKSALTDQQKEFATNQYSKYQSLEDQVRSGKTISKSEFEDLTPQLAKYFTQMANGTRKMTGDAEQFYAKVNALKLQGFNQNMDSLNQRIEAMQKLSGQDIDLDYLDRSAAAGYWDDEGVNILGYDQKLAEDQLNFIKEMNPELEDTVKAWQKINAEHKLGIEDLEKIRDYVSEIGESTDLATLKEGYAEAAHQLHEAMFPTDADVDESALQSLTETIQSIATSSAQLHDQLATNAYDAEDIAESILRFDDAIQDVVDHYDEWMGALNSGSVQEQAEAIAGLRDAYADLLDLDGSSLSESFLTNADNLNLMKAAIDGDIDAYDQLMQLAGQDIAMQVHLNTEAFQQDFNDIMDKYYQGQNLEDMEIGASLNDEDFLNELGNMVTAAHMTAQQATDYLASMGVDAEVVQQKTTAEDAQHYVDAVAQVNPGDQIPGTNPATGAPVTYRFPSVQYKLTPSDATQVKEQTAYTLKVTSAHKTSGGGFKFKQAANGGGSKGQARRAGTPSKGGGGGGGGGKGAQPDTSKKDPKKHLEDQKDIYHDIDIEIKKINRDLKRVQQQQDRLYGKQLLDNLNKQTAILEAQKDKLKEKQQLQKKDLKNQQETLKNLGVTFDQYGNINNYLSILEAKQRGINSLIDQENVLIGQYNASTDKDFKSAINQQITAYEKAIKEAQDDLKNTQTKIGNYDKLRENMEDLVDEIEEITQKEIELNIKKFRYQVEIRLDMGEAARDWNEFVREVLNRNDAMQDNDFTKTFKDMNKSVMDLGSYFDVNGSIGSLQALTNQLLETREQIQQIDKLGTSSIYGDNKAKAMEDLQKDLSELMKQMQDVSKILEQIDEAYLDTIDNIADEFERQADDYEFIGQLIEHDMDLLSLLYGDKNYNAMNNYYNQLQQNQLNQVDSLRKQMDFWKKEWNDALAAGDTNAAEKFEENYKKTIKDLNSLIEESAKTILDKYSNAIEQIFDELDKKLTNNKGTDFIGKEWDLMNKNAEEYLDTINSAYAIQDLQTKFQKAINDTTQLKNQKALKQVMDEQLTNLKNKQKITQYDIDRAEKLLQVEQARIALEEAQSSKTSLRLKRNSQGNYSYEYAADQDSIAEAQQNLAQAQNSLYNFDKERYQSNLNDILSAWKDFQSEYKDIVLDASLTEEEKVRELALLREEYGEYINDKTEENLNIRNNLMESAFADIAALYEEDVANYQRMTDDQKNILMGDLVPAWTSSIQQMTDKVAGEGGFITVCESAFEDITETTMDYEQQLQQLATTAGISLNDITNGVDTLTFEFEELIETNDDLILRMERELDSIQDLRYAAQELVDSYEDVYRAAAEASSELYYFVQAQQSAAAASKAAGDAYDAMKIQMGEADKRYAAVASAAMESLANAAENAAARTEAAAQRINDALTSAGNGGSTNSGRNGPPPGTDQVWWRFQHHTGQNTFSTKKPTTGATGMYTGDWHSNEGKWAILHEKEIVLNKEDTKNFLNGIGILRQITQQVGQNAFSKIGQISNSRAMGNLVNSQSDSIEQSVQISASFPNVDSKREIEEAFNDLINLAQQRALRS